MSVLSKDEALELIKTHIGEANDDDTLKFVEDMSDTLNEMEKKANGDGTDWKSKYEENDKAWREKYRERFFNGTPNCDDSKDDNEDKDVEDKTTPKTFEELFK